METPQETRYVKRTQKDYTMSFKLQVVQEIELGELSTHAACRKYGIQARSTIVQWLRKFGNFDWENQTPSNMAKTPEQKIMELEVQVKLLEKQKTFLERQAFVADKKAILFDMMINLAEKTLYPNNRSFQRKRATNNSIYLLFVRDRQTGLLSKN